MSDTAKPAGASGASERPSGEQPATAPAAPAATPGAAPSAEPVDPAAAAAASAAQPDPIATLESKIKELEAQKADLTDRLLRTVAEMDNMRKRTEREKADTARYAITKFASDIVGVSDNFQRAVAAIPPGAAEQDGVLKSLVDGVLMSERAFLQVLEGNGVRRLDPKGEQFDPNRHQAVMEEANPEVSAGTVLKVFQAGYMIEERVLRPAMVVVARGGAKPTKDTGAGAGNGAPGAGPAGGAKG